MSVPNTPLAGHYIMYDQVPAKVRAIMEQDSSHWSGGLPRTDPGPMLSRPGWVAITLLVIAFNLMAVLPPAA